MTSSNRATHLLTAPRSGEVVVLRFDGRQVAVWWGPDGDLDRLAVQSGLVLTWPTAAACEEHARQQGWVGLGADDGDEAIGHSALDFEPAQAWLRGRRNVVDVKSALELWNSQWDVTASLTGAYPVLRRLEHRCHEKLTTANVPWLVGEDVYRPRWTAAELRSLRHVLSKAVHVLRTSLR